MKRGIAYCCIIVLTAYTLSGCGNANVTTSSSGSTDAAGIIGDIPTVQEFTDEVVDEADLKTILASGINAPSAMNGQPWHFSAVTDKSVLEQIVGDMGGGMPPAGGKGKKPPMDKKDMKDMPVPPSGGSGTKAGIADAPVAIIISCKEGSEFDAGLACESMADMANVMGYGTKIISSPTMALNGEKKDDYKKTLDIPDDMSTVAVLLVGHPKDGSDVATGATTRNPFDDVVSFVR